MTDTRDQLDRKDSHIALCLESDVEFSSFNFNGFANYRFDHDALPEINKREINLETKLFGKKLSAPLFLGAMTGGTARAGEINRRLALAAARCQVGFALGSQRKMLEMAEARQSYMVRNHAPDLPLLMGNIGAVQLNYGVGAPDLKSLIRDTGCDVFNFHLNPLQEAIQPEGNVDFSNLLPKLRDVIPQLEIPVVVKEVGAGISRVTAEKLKSLPIAGIETAGLGGTSWAKIESLRTTDKMQRSVGDLFARWGIPTVESLLVCRQVCPHLNILASGGIRNGIEVAKAIALGADAAGVALPFLKAAELGVDNVVEAIELLKEELMTVMFLTGARTVADLKTRKLRGLRDGTAWGER